MLWSTIRMGKYLGLKDDGVYYAAKRETEFLNFYEKKLERNTIGYLL